jgi:hypothetical protein
MATVSRSQASVIRRSYWQTADTGQVRHSTSMVVSKTV